THHAGRDPLDELGPRLGRAVPRRHDVCPVVARAGDLRVLARYLLRCSRHAVPFRPQFAVGASSFAPTISSTIVWTSRRPASAPHTPAVSTASTSIVGDSFTQVH